MPGQKGRLRGCRSAITPAASRLGKKDGKDSDGVGDRRRKRSGFHRNSTREQKCAGFQMSAAPVRRWVSGPWKAKAGKAQKPAVAVNRANTSVFPSGEKAGVRSPNWDSEEVVSLVFFAAFKRKGVQPEVSRKTSAGRNHPLAVWRPGQTAMRSKQLTRDRGFLPTVFLCPQWVESAEAKHAQGSPVARTQSIGRPVTRQGWSLSSGSVVKRT